MRALKFVSMILALTLSLNAFAGSYFNKRGTISAVDLENNTFSVVNYRSDDTKVYSFPENIKIIIKGVVYQDKSIIKPGQHVTLKFKQNVAASTIQSNNVGARDLTISGTVIEMDRVARKGELRKDRSKDIVAFRFSENFKNKDLPRIGDKVVFTYILESLKIGMN